MKLKGIKDPIIAKERYDNILHIKGELSYQKWIEYIDNHNDYFIWNENTENGIYEKDNIGKVPEWAKEGVLRSLNKHKVFAEFNRKKSWYEIVINYSNNYIDTTFMKPIKKKHLMILLDMANYLDALLLNHGDEIIDEKVIKSLE